MKALSQAVPHQVSAGVGNLHVVAFSGIRDETHWVHMEIHEGCYGGRYGKDGMDRGRHPLCQYPQQSDRGRRIASAAQGPPLRTARRRLPAGSLARRYRLDPRGRISRGRRRGRSKGEGHKYAPWGFDGGGDGRTAGLTFRRKDGADLDLPSKLPNMTARAGDRIVMIGPCGGGYGDPMARDPAQVLEDVRDGLISAENRAARLWGRDHRIHDRRRRGDRSRATGGTGRNTGMKSRSSIPIRPWR